jgi:hypothetical protein
MDHREAARRKRRKSGSGGAEGGVPTLAEREGGWVVGLLRTDTFRDDTTLIKLVLPDGVTSIEGGGFREGAFSGCTSLEGWGVPRHGDCHR